MFDLKGSTVDRNVLEVKDKAAIKEGKKQEMLEKYKKKVLKDNDFKDLEFKFQLSKKRCHVSTTEHSSRCRIT